MCYYISCARPLNESNEELRMKQWCLYLHSSFPFFKIMQSKRQSYYHYLSSEDKKEKEKSLVRLVRDRQRRYRSWLVNLGDH